MSEGVRFDEFSDVQRVRVPPTPLWHYTNRAGLLGILTERTLWATDARYLNDASELRHARDLYRDQLSGRIAQATGREEACLRRMLQEESSSVLSEALFVFSLSENLDDLSQWRAYSQPGSAYAIGFDPVGLNKLCPLASGRRLVSVDYDDQAKSARIRAIIDSALSKTAQVEEEPRALETAIHSLSFYALSEVARRAVQMKHASFSKEAEWRLVQVDSLGRATSFRDGARFLAPYREISIGESLKASPICAIMVGPSAHTRLEVDALSRLVEALGSRTLSVTASDVPYRNW